MRSLLFSLLCPFLCVSLSLSLVLSLHPPDCVHPSACHPPLLFIFNTWLQQPPASFLIMFAFHYIYFSISNSHFQSSRAVWTGRRPGLSFPVPPSLISIMVSVDVKHPEGNSHSAPFRFPKSKTERGPECSCRINIQRMYLWWSLCTLCLHTLCLPACPGDSYRGRLRFFCCCTCVTYFER